MKRPLPSVGRLLVLVPNGPLPVVELAQRVWHLAAPAGWAVLLLGLAEDPEREPALRRTLALLAAHTRHDPVAVSTRVAVAVDWLAALRPVWRPGDLIVCFDGQARRGWLGSPRALSEVIQATLEAPVYVLPDGPRPGQGRWRQAAAQWAWVALNLAVIAGFFELQTWIQQVAAGGAALALLSLSVVVEFALLGLVHQTLMRD
ncbi:MAG: hypothetical protein IT318_25655 [Anaerolineales bacterium]|nr:hypothetical protein [Anaerolineales bacterium]